VAEREFVPTRSASPAGHFKINQTAGRMPRAADWDNPRSGLRAGACGFNGGGKLVRAREFFPLETGRTRLGLIVMLVLNRKVGRVTPCAPA
jgi:hypothetical protein